MKRILIFVGLKIVEVLLIVVPCGLFVGIIFGILEGAESLFGRDAVTTGILIFYGCFVGLFLLGSITVMLYMWCRANWRESGKLAKKWKGKKWFGLFVLMFVLAFGQANGQVATFDTTGKEVPRFYFKTQSICTRVDTIWGWGFRPANVEMMMPTHHWEERYPGLYQVWTTFNLWRAVRIMQIDSVFEDRSESGWIRSMEYHRRTFYEDGKIFIPKKPSFFLADAAVMKPDTLRMER